jgi:hypothetical protein
MVPGFFDLCCSFSTLQKGTTSKRRAQHIERSATHRTGIAQGEGVERSRKLPSKVHFEKKVHFWKERPLLHSVALENKKTKLTKQETEGRR